MPVKVLDKIEATARISSGFGGSGAGVTGTLMLPWGEEYDSENGLWRNHATTFTFQAQSASPVLNRYIPSSMNVMGAVKGGPLFSFMRMPGRIA